MKKLILIMLFMLCGCALTQTPIVTSEQVKVPVPVLCTVTYPDKPDDLFANLKPTDSILVKGNTAIAMLKEEEIYANELFAALTSCTTASTNATTQTQQ